MMLEGLDCALNSIVVAVALNLVLPVLVVKFVKLTADDTIIGKMYGILEHHKQTPVASSIIVAAIVFLSVMIGYKLKLF